MGEAEIKLLKVKCNKLIEKALQLEKEIEKKDVQIGQLMEKKKLLEAQICWEPEEKGQSGEVEIFPEEILSLPQVRQEAAENESLAALENSPSISNVQIYKMIQSLSMRMEDRREEIVVRKISTGGKILELLADGVGKIFKLIALCALMGLVSLAATVLLNGELRSVLIEFFRGCFG
ncbi:MAG: hypothetical protein HDR14_16470 [Lachnospiraceae bacterium]|nr:hypothetical protein [Lachnospiraceae bacterium]